MTLDFRLGHDFRATGWSPTSGLCTQHQSACLPLSWPLPTLVRTLSLKQINLKKQKQKQNPTTGHLDG